MLIYRNRVVEQAYMIAALTLHIRILTFLILNNIKNGRSFI